MNRIRERLDEVDYLASLEGAADQKTFNARILSDGEDAKHPREAVLAQSRKAANPRRTAKATLSGVTEAGCPAENTPCDEHDGRE